MRRFSSLRSLAPLLLGGALLVLGSSFAPASTLTDQIDELLHRWQVNEAFWGVAVYDVNAEQMLYSRNLEHSFLPASNQKLFTSATALDALGSTHRYETILHYDGAVTDSVMRGDLILEGSGDPTFGSVEVQGDDPFKIWSNRLAEMGINRVEGRLIGDDDAFDDRPYPPGWTVTYITRQKGRQMGTSAGGLSYRDNVVPLKIRATRPGARPSVEVNPKGVVSIDNQAITSSRWRGSTLQINRAFSTNELILTGSVAQSYSGTFAVPVSNPTEFALESFRQRLQEVGIQTDLTLVDIDSLDEHVDHGSPLFVTHSQPLAEIVAVMNKESNNFYAEQVFRSYGWGGSARGASKRTKSFLQRAGVDTRKLLVKDGSGLSRKDLVTPQAMVKLLSYMTEHEEQDAFLTSLPYGGEYNTTLDDRLHRTDVKAKTGSLKFVRALSGYTNRPNGNRVAFALFVNNYTGPSYRVSRTINDIVQAIASVES